MFKFFIYDFFHNINFNIKTQQSLLPKNQLTFDDFDKLDLKSFSDDLFQVIEKGLASSIGEMGEKRGWTISLNAPFGNGKTTFLKMFEHFIKTEKKDYEVLFINAWESDFSKEPVIAILAEFVNYLNQNNQKSTAKKVIKVMGNLGNQAIQYLASKAIQYQTGLDIKQPLSFISKFLKNLINFLKKTTIEQELGDNLLEEFNQKKSAIEKVKKILSEYNKNTGKNLLIIVDELDRTKPDYAVHFLEDMKHFFDIENVAFLVAVNQTQMKATVKCLFGQDLDFEGYYRKFFKQEMDIPDPYIKAQNLLYNLVGRTNLKHNINQKDRGYMLESTYLFCKNFELTLREIENLIRIFEMILRNKNQGIKFEYIYAYSFFICLFLKRRNVFKSISKGDFNVDKFISFIREDSSLKIFIENPKDEKFDNEQFLLFIIAQSFSIRESKLGFEETKQIIEKTFDRVIQISAFPEYGPVAVKICKKIDRCQSNL